MGLIINKCNVACEGLPVVLNYLHRFVATAKCESFRKSSVIAARVLTADQLVNVFTFEIKVVTGLWTLEPALLIRRKRSGTAETCLLVAYYVAIVIEAKRHVLKVPRIPRVNCEQKTVVRGGINFTEITHFLQALCITGKVVLTGIKLFVSVARVRRNSHVPLIIGGVDAALFSGVGTGCSGKRVAFTSLAR